MAMGSGADRAAHAAGMFVTPHGARPLGRGGAFVAGADDLNAIYYNPAGVAAIDPGTSGWSGLLDAGLVLQHVTYTRDENGIMRPPVTTDNNPLGGAPLAIPQFAFAKQIPRSWGSMSFGFGVWIPYTGLPRYPEGQYDTEQNLQQVPNVSPQRYQLISLHDGDIGKSTLLAVLNPVAAFSLLKGKLQLGIGPQLMLVYFRSRIMLSSCTQVMCRPEQVDFDTLVLAQAFAVTPSFNVGAMYRPLPWLRLGAAFQFPFLIRSSVGTVDARLPANELFNGAQVVGRDASLALNLPPILRVGVEFHPIPNRLRIELAYTAEFWNIQDQVTFTPQGISIQNLKGIGTYQLGPVAIDREMQLTHTIHLGLEGTIWKYLGARLGGMFETGSMPDATITVLTPDGLKGMISVGAFLPKVHFAHTDWRFDVAYGRIIQPDRVVAAADSKIYPSNPIRPDAMYPPGVGGIGGGRYEVSYDLITLGFSAVR
jgi:long-chain fatty acid transport protein